jgi:pimeloyl-ACP methyl ester carboxylesterase
MATIVLFPGFDCNKATWSKIIEYGHPKHGSRAPFLVKLQKLGRPIHFADVTWKKDFDIAAFLRDLHESLSGKKLILVGHSLGILFCYLYAKKYKDQCLGMISIDGSYFGPSAIEKIAKAVESKNEDLIYFVNHIPIKKLSMPVPTICYRNLKLKEPTLLKYTDESANKKYEVRYYVDKGHFLHYAIPNDIIAGIASFI